jgi:hypothetical protein
MRLVIGRCYRVADGKAFAGTRPGTPLLLDALVPGSGGMEAVFVAHTSQGPQRFHLSVGEAEAALLPLPERLEDAAARHAGLATWQALLDHLAGGGRVVLPLPVNGDSSVDAFVRWHQLMERHGLAMLPGDGCALLARAGSFSRAELDAAAARVRDFAAGTRETPPWVSNGRLDPDYFA